MNIGILTFHNIPNIGAVLQAYSLCSALRDLGAECEIIDYTCDNIRKRELDFRSTGNYIRDIFYRLFVWPKTKKKIEACQQFMKKHKAYSNIKYTHNSLDKTNDSYDAFISGSDMIWNLDVTSHDWSYFLAFVREDKPRYAYGSSIGAKWDSIDIPKVRLLLNQYTSIGVRENDTCAYLNTIGLKAKLVCDPTLLICKDQWAKMAARPKESCYVLVYFPSDININAAKKYASAHNLSVIVMNWARTIPGVINVSPTSPEQWIGYIMYSDAVFTGSYHGLLFSIYFEKPVWTDNYSNRVQSLLDRLQIASNRLDDDIALNTVIDYTRVTLLVNEFRGESIEYLKTIVEAYKS